VHIITRFTRSLHGSFEILLVGGFDDRGDAVLGPLSEGRKFRKDVGSGHGQ